MPTRTRIAAALALALSLPLVAAQTASASKSTSSAPVPFNAITYVGYSSSSGYDLWTMDAAGANQKMLTKSGSSTSKTTTTNTPSVEWAPVYSPGGGYVAFESRRAGGNGDVWVQDTTTFAMTRVTSSSALEAPGGWYTASDGGLRIVYSRDDGTLWSVHPDGTGNVQVSDAVPGLSRFAARNDGEIAASVDVDGVNRIYTLAIGSKSAAFPSEWTQVTYPTGTENDYTPAWNPATGALVFNREGDYRLDGTEIGHLLSLPAGALEATTTPTTVVQLETRDINPAFSADGTQLAFAVSQNATGTTGYEIAIAPVNADGTASTPKIVTSTGGLVSQPTWKS